MMQRKHAPGRHDLENCFDQLARHEARDDDEIERWREERFQRRALAPSQIDQIGLDGSHIRQPLARRKGGQMVEEGWLVVDSDDTPTAQGQPHAVAPTATAQINRTPPASRKRERAKQALRRPKGITHPHCMLIALRLEHWYDKWQVGRRFPQATRRLS